MQEKPKVPRADMSINDATNTNCHNINDLASHTVDSDSEAQVKMVATEEHYDADDNSNETFLVGGKGEDYDNPDVESLVTDTDFMDRKDTGEDKDDNDDEDDDDDDETVEESLVPDGGWGWIVCLASFMINFILDGTMFSFGIMLLWLLSDLGQDKATTSWVGSALLGVSMIMGPVVSILLERFTIRQVTICGALLSTAGFIASVFAPNVYMLIATFGVIGGIGFGMAFLPAIIVVGLYFNTKRAIATGIATSGSGLGTFAYAYISDGLLTEFNWRGTVLILAGLVLNCAVCGLLFRPLVAKPTTRQKERKRCKHKGNFDDRQKQNLIDSRSASSGYSSDHIAQFKPSIDDVVAATEEEGRDKALTAASNNHLVPVRRSSTQGSASPLQLNTVPMTKDYHNNDAKEVSGDLVISNISVLGNGCAKHHENASTLSLLKDAIRNRQNLNKQDRTEEQSSGKDSIIQIQEIQGISQPYLSDKDGSIFPRILVTDSALSPQDGYGFKLKPLGRLYKSVDYLHRVAGSGTLNVSENTRIRLLSSEYKLNEFGVGNSRNFNNSFLRYRAPNMGSKNQISKGLMKPILRKDIYYSGSVNHLPAFRQLGSVNTFMAAMTRTSSTDDDDVISARRDRKKTNSFVAAIKKALPVSLFMNKTFNLLLITFSMWTAQSVSLTYLPDLAVSIGVERADAAFLISIVGIANVLGRVVAGFVADTFQIPSIWLYFVALLSASVVNVVVAFADSFITLAVCSGIFGLCMAVAVSMRTIVLAEQLGIEALTRSFGVVALFQGIAFTISPPIAGKLIDEFHSFQPPFMMAAFMYLIACLSTLLVAIMSTRKQKSRQQAPSSLSLDVASTL